MRTSTVWSSSISDRIFRLARVGGRSCSQLSDPSSLEFWLENQWRHTHTLSFLPSPYLFSSCYTSSAHKLLIKCSGYCVQKNKDSIKLKLRVRRPPTEHVGHWTVCSITWLVLSVRISLRRNARNRFCIVTRSILHAFSRKFLLIWRKKNLQIDVEATCIDESWFGHGERPCHRYSLRPKLL